MPPKADLNADSGVTETPVVAETPVENAPVVETPVVSPVAETLVVSPVATEETAADTTPLEGATLNTAAPLVPGGNDQYSIFSDWAASTGPFNYVQVNQYQTSFFGN